MQRRVSYLLFVFLVVGLVGCDHATKHIAQSELRGQPPVTLVKNVFELRYTENRDIGFSILRGIPEPVRRPLIFLGGTVGLSLLGILWWHRRRAAWQEHTAYAVLLGGAIGNLGDRLARGYVVDFMHIQHWPVFNVADICLVVGIGLLWITTRRQPALSVATGPAATAGPPARQPPPERG